ncbi:hypothetical protein [Sphingobacterium endophyticum]|uniref:hypothetical protein n=1 Tax=Sphingobacterium endophyticum TaxID=2546448 RepID=UPI0012E25B72|nr:hypothetical protein [Sphingobacterium endophyticum]
MSWDIVLFKADRKVDLQDPQIENYLQLFDFNSAIEMHFREIEKSVDFWEIIGDGYSINYYPDNQKCTHTMVNLYGEKGLFELIQLARKHNLQIYDSGLDDFLDLEHPENNGYKNFIGYVKQIMEKEK